MEVLAAIQSRLTELQSVFEEKKISLRLEVLMGAFRSLPADCQYSQIPPEVREAVAQLGAEQGIEAQALLLKILLLAFAEQNWLKTLQNKMRWPKEVLEYSQRWMQTTLDEIDQQAAEFFSFNEDLYLKSLGFCRGIMLPTGAQVIEVNRLPLGYVKTAGPKAWWFALRLRRARMFQLHTESRWLDHFNPEGWTASYRLWGKILRMQPDIQGIFGSSWFYDPKLAEISPRLAYLRDISAAGGAEFFKLGAFESDKANALSKSKTRMRLYEQGKYLPTSYIQVWPREQLLNWCALNR